ncbi:MAG: UvrB/UvrC motif-containing protein [Planctomycetota bacterium]
MKHKCDKCDRPATYHAVEIIKGKKISKHLCDLHAAEEGLIAKSAHTPINELLTNFVKMSGTNADKQGSNSGVTGLELVCGDCGLTFSKFREKSLLGCPSCYKAFEGPLSSLTERAHEGGNHHIGKVPRRSGAGEQRQLLLTRMRKRLEAAVEAEDYELAARLRDDIEGIGGEAEVSGPDAPGGGDAR